MKATELLNMNIMASGRTYFCTYFWGAVDSYKANVTPHRGSALQPEIHRIAGLYQFSMPDIPTNIPTKRPGLACFLTFKLAGRLSFFTVLSAGHVPIKACNYIDYKLRQRR